jgi:hypothetical protein
VLAVDFTKTAKTIALSRKVFHCVFICVKIPFLIQDFDFANDKKMFHLAL